MAKSHCKNGVILYLLRTSVHFCPKVAWRLLLEGIIMYAVKKRIYKIISPHKSDDLSSTVFDWSIVSLIIINVLVIIIDTLDLPQVVSFVFGIIEIVSVVIFTVEYLLRLWGLRLFCVIGIGGRLGWGGLGLLGGRRLGLLMM